MSKPTTLYDKIWNDHLVHEGADGTCLLYIDRHLVHEVTIDVEEAGSVRLLVDQMVVPDLVVEGAWLGHGSLPECLSALF